MPCVCDRCGKVCGNAGALGMHRKRCAPVAVGPEPEPEPQPQPAVEVPAGPTLLDLQKQEVEARMALERERVAMEQKALEQRLEMERMVAMAQKEDIQERRDIEVAYRSAKLQIEVKERGKDREVYDRYLQEKNRLMDKMNNRPICMTLDVHLLQSDEFQVYGTRAQPLLRKQDVDEFARRCIAGRFQEEPFGEALKEAIDFAAHHEEIDLQNGRRVREEVVPLLSWDRMTSRLEKAVDLPPNEVEGVYKRMVRHEALNDGKVSASARWGAIPEERLVHPRSPSPSEVGDAVDQAPEVALLPGGLGPDELQQIRAFHHHMEKVAQILETSKVLREDPELREGIATSRARCNLIWQRIEGHGVYVPDVVERYMQDQRALREGLVSKTMPDKLRLYKERKGMCPEADCDVCGEAVTPDTYERAHIVPSMSGTVGSNGSHNLLVACRDCNQRMKNMDALLYRDVKIRRC